MKHFALRPLIAGLAALAALGAHAQSSTPVFDEATRQLTLPVVRLGGTNFLNVTVRLDQFEVLGVGATEPVEPPPAAGQCTTANFTREKFYGIVGGMTVQQVNTLMGCAYNPAYTISMPYFLQFTWQAVDGPASMSLSVDTSGTRVLASDTKQASGF